MDFHQILTVVMQEAQDLLRDDAVIVVPGTKLLNHFDDLDLTDFLMALEDEFSMSFGEEQYNTETVTLQTPQQFAEYIEEHAEV
ncbi:hypothetical protein BcepSauron_118 [Burkholderia phage BcepSauron]|uniref:Uncharacterized protein n=2 Tax=Sarumanvirus TaxID=2843450 RepID=A0A482MLJ4_9CAUD|nr:acyl carrier protein-like protein [Burkholderia phage BcepSaruman]YP_009904496.1 hypothetical protein H1O17_gp118 [Burkholderia phage BcepSauron]QBQ74498.1 hypothetical protein BcepSauron_118 [Burkholderia phage BcepSauron]QBX06532.1 acyl carrier protein-like protein [Burkholderia phage BcepSaruman]